MSNRRAAVPSERFSPTRVLSFRPLLLPLATIAVLASFLAVEHIRANVRLLISFAGAVAILATWLVVLSIRARASRRSLTTEWSLRPQHYLQALAHTMIFVYWGFYWPPIQEAAPLIAAQIVFAYAFDMLLTWSRRDTFVLGFGPFPIIYSTNLFLRFHDDWFYLQFLMVAIGFLAKELIRWNRDGRRVHIFNPSSFPLAVFSLGLILTGTTEITWGEEIATLLIMPPQMFLFIFLVALPGQYLFRVTTMTLPAVATTYLFSLAHLQVTGTYFFFDSNVPIAVFLGMHLLFTDPSTSPRTELGRIVFGIFYGFSVVALYAILDWFGAPTFYDKLLQVPIMNLMVKQFDRISGAVWLQWMNPERIGAGLAPRRRSLAYVSLWIVAFGAMSAANGVGDHHPGHTVPFWDEACRNGRANACERMAQINVRYCNGGSGWACNELAILSARNVPGLPPAAETFQRACAVGSIAGCQNQALVAKGQTNFKRDDPKLDDYALLLQDGRGPIPESTPLDVFMRACAQGWLAGCGSLGDTYFQRGGPGRVQGVLLWQQACENGHAGSCANLGVMHRRGDGVPKDEGQAATFMNRACSLGLDRACDLAKELASPGR